MTKKELIELLTAYPNDTPVYFEDYTTTTEVEVHEVRVSNTYRNAVVLFNHEL